MYRVAIVEDNPSDASLLRELLDRYASAQENVQFNCVHYPSPLEFLESCRAEFDLIFLDIEMPGINGMETARQLREIDEEVVIIFVTRMAQYALWGYEVSALDFILKPLNYYTLSMKLKKALRHISRANAPTLRVNTTDGYVRIACSQISYIESRDHYLTYHTEKCSYQVRGTLKTVEAELAPLHFSRCGNSYLVNLRAVKGVQNNMVLVGDEKLPISRSRHTAFLQELASYLGGST